MKKRIPLRALLCAGVLCLATACGSKPDKKPENREAMIKEAENLPDAEIKIPAAWTGDELADIPTETTDNNEVTCQLDGDTRTRILNDLAAEIETSIDTILADKDYYPNISDITVNSDCTEFTIYLTSAEPNLYESSLMMSFYTVGGRYQIYNGVSAENARTTVVYVNAESGDELARTDSSAVQ